MRRYPKIFYGGLFIGAGVGLAASTILVEQELLTLGHRAWVWIPASALVILGTILAGRPAPPKEP